MSFSRIAKCISNFILGGGVKRESEDKGQDESPPEKKSKITDNEETPSGLKKELENIQSAVSTQIERVTQKLKTVEASSKKCEEENTKLKDMLITKTMEIQTDKSEIQELRDKNKQLVDILLNRVGRDNETKQNPDCKTGLLDSIDSSNGIVTGDSNSVLLPKIHSSVLNAEETFKLENTEEKNKANDPVGEIEKPDNDVISTLVKTIQHLITDRESKVNSSNNMEKTAGTNSENAVSVNSTATQKVISASTADKSTPINQEKIAEPAAQPADKSAPSNLEKISEPAAKPVDTAPVSVPEEKPTTTNSEKADGEKKEDTSNKSSEKSDSPETKKEETAPKSANPVEDAAAAAIAAATAAVTAAAKLAESAKQIKPEVIDENQRFDKIKGLDEQIKFLRQNILFPITNREVLLQCGVEPIKGIVFYGAGCDMAFLAKALTNELSQIVGKKYNFFQRFKKDVFGKYGGESGKYITELFKEATVNTPAVVFIEDIHTLWHHCSVLGPYAEIVKVFNSEMSKITTVDVLVIVTTDELKKVDPTALGAGRLEKSLAFQAPTEERRKSILEFHTSKWKVLPTGEILTEMAKKSENFKHDDLEKLCHQSFLSAIQRKLDKDRCQHCHAGNNLKLEANSLESVEVLPEDWELTVTNMVKQKSPATTASKPVDESIISDKNLGFSSVGGLEEQIRILKEGIMFPLANKAALQDWGVEPVKGIIFNGPPGCGKTLLAKALAAELSRLEDTPFSFFYHKGTDSYNCYVGETGKNLRNIFANAVAKKPAIIFFDEIDGLCATRSDESSSNFYNGVVTTMLGLLDNVKRGEVFVIAATNRMDALDPALRRPGRFDKTVTFFPPNEEGRRSILGIHSAKWKGGHSEEILAEISKQTAGYTGADLEQLCRQTFLSALKRKFPDLKQDAGVYKMKDEGLAELDIILADWYTALGSVKGSNSCVFGNSISTAKVTPADVSKLLSGIIQEIVQKMEPFIKDPPPSVSSKAEKGFGINSFLIWDAGNCQARIIDNFVIPNLLNCPEFKDCISFTLSEDKLMPCKLKSLMSQVLNCDKVAILYIPAIEKIGIQLAAAGENSHSFFMEQMDSLRGEKVLLLASAGSPISELPEDFRRLFKGMPGSRHYNLRRLKNEESREFFAPIFQQRFPKQLDKVAQLTASANLYDLLDLKAELNRACASAKEKELSDTQLAAILSGILDEFKNNKLDIFKTHNHTMYT